MKKIYRWKFLRTGFKSAKGNLKWEIGKWNKVDGELSMCENGLHCSRHIYDAFYYVQGEILARVECGGDHIIRRDKECWREQRVVKAYEWTKKDCVAIAIYAARLVLPIFEKAYPDDKRPRLAIEAAVNWLKTPTEEKRTAAKMAAKEAYKASRVPWNDAAVRAETAIRIGNGAGAAVETALVVRRKDSLDAAIKLWEELAAVKLISQTAIKKIRVRFSKQVKKLKEIK